jgi:hypothetical protein
VPAGRIVYRESRELDGIDYEIIVYSASGGLYGTWTCPKCGFEGINAVFSSTKDEATDLACQGLTAHHHAVHRSP